MILVTAKRRHHSLLLHDQLPEGKCLWAKLCKNEGESRYATLCLSGSLIAGVLEYRYRSLHVQESLWCHCGALFVQPHGKHCISAKTERFNEGVLDHRDCSKFCWLFHQTGNRQKCLYTLVLYLHAWVKHVLICLCDESLRQQFSLCSAWPVFFLVERSKKKLSFLLDLENRLLSQDLHELWARDTWNQYLKWSRAGSCVTWSSQESLGPMFLAPGCFGFLSFSGLTMVHSIYPIYSIPSSSALGWFSHFLSSEFPPLK